jgi:hypothetical protein
MRRNLIRLILTLIALLAWAQTVEETHAAQVVKIYVYCSGVYKGPSDSLIADVEQRQTSTYTEQIAQVDMTPYVINPEDIFQLEMPLTNSLDKSAQGRGLWLKYNPSNDSQGYTGHGAWYVDFVYDDGSKDRYFTVPPAIDMNRATDEYQLPLEGPHPIP